MGDGLDLNVRRWPLPMARRRQDGEVSTPAHAPGRQAPGRRPGTLEWAASSAAHVHSGPFSTLQGFGRSRLLMLMALERFGSCRGPARQLRCADAVGALQHRRIYDLPPGEGGGGCEGITANQPPPRSHSHMPPSLAKRQTWTNLAGSVRILPADGWRLR